MGSDLPDYELPPLVEVMFAVSMRPFSMALADLASLATDSFGDRYTIHSDSPPAQMPKEIFDDEVEMMKPSLSLLTGTPPVRLLFQSQDREQVIQLQRDWFACNWQNLAGSVKYPHYNQIEKFFLESFDKFREFTKRRAAVEPSVTQCELTYINHILLKDVPGGYANMSKIVRLAGQASGFLPDPEDTQVMYRYRIINEGEIRGRLYAHAFPAYRGEDREKIFQLNLIARGVPKTEDRSGMVEFFRLAHEWIVKGFASVTTKEAQTELWRIK